MAIKIKKSHKGLLHKNLGIPKDKPIPASKLKIKSSDSPAVKKRKQFAINAKHWHHKAQDGDVLPVTDKTGKRYIVPNNIIQEFTDNQSLLPIQEPDYKRVMGQSAYIPQINMGPSVEQSFQDVGRDLSHPAKPFTRNKSTFNWGDAALAALTATDMLLPQQKIKKPVVFPTTSYNAHQYGTGSQAIAQEGITLSTTGYKANSKDKNKAKLRIPSNSITMKGVPHPVIGTDNNGNQIVMQPGQDYLFPNAEYVDEQPAKKGKKIQGQYVSKSYKVGGEIEELMAVGGKLSQQKASEMLKDGTAHGKKLTPKQEKYFRAVAHGWSPKKAGDGWLGEGYAKNGLHIEDDKFTPISDQTLMINGDSHEDGGTMVKYGNKTVEAEKGEPLSIDNQGNAVIFGNLKNPVTGNKFKTDAMKLAKKEARVNKLMDYSTKLVNTSNPYDKWDNLKFNAGQAMMIGAKMKSENLLSLKEHLGDLQEGMLALKNEGNQESKNGLKMHTTAQRGVSLPNGRTVTYKEWLKYQNSQQLPVEEPNTNSNVTLSMAQRHNNPGNMKYEEWMSKYGAVPGEPDNTTKDGTTYARFPDMQSGISAMKDKLFTRPRFGNMTIEQAVNTWTGGHPYGNIPNSIKGKRLKDMTPQEQELAFSTFTMGEDSKVYNNVGVTDAGGKPRIIPTQTPIDLGGVNAPIFAPVAGQHGPNNEIGDGQYDWTLKEYKDIPSPSNAEKLQFKQVLPEIYGATHNQQEPVWLQQYQPELYQPYNVSFQDRRNQITSQGRASRQFLNTNANAQATLAAGEYDALNSVNADEFRTNQGIAEDITNKNIALLNESKKYNLGLADTQYTRQARAKSLTKAANQDILNSLSNKVLQNQLENRTLQVYENMYPHYRYDDQYTLKKTGNPGQDYLTVGSLNPQNNNIGSNTSMVKTVNPDGTLKQIKYNTPSAIKTAIDNIKLQDDRLKTFGNSMQGFFNKRKK